ncbi:tyrosine-type recombinase/integrase [Duncaniella muris]|uniref:tyrosine-type recombinase/integrase n=1 Tax=Duncaniella muris TaxID=2094150 RepID=UPI003F663DE3
MGQAGRDKQTHNLALCRHSFAVNVLSAGANIKTVSSLLGHASIKMTEKYLHVIDNQKKDAMNSLEEYHFGVMTYSPANPPRMLKIDSSYPVAFLTLWLFRLL